MDFKILIVDNIPGQLRALENVLKEMGHKNVLTSRNAKDASDILDKNPDIDLVISEWDLPDKSGLELLKSIRANTSLAKTPFILTFQVKSKSDILKASQARATGFIVKPYKLEVVKQKISEILKAGDTHMLPKIEAQGGIDASENSTDQGDSNGPANS